MRNRSWSSAVCVAVATVLWPLAAVPDNEEPAALEAEAGIPALSAYVWRGQVINDEPVLQPSVTVGKFGFAFETWLNVDLTRVDGKRSDLSEVDLTLSYSHTFDPITMAVGIVQYIPVNTTSAAQAGAPDIPAGEPAEPTREIFAGVTLEDLPVVPSASVYCDVDSAEGLYAVLALDYSTSISSRIDLEIGASIGFGSAAYNDFYFGVDDAALNDLSVSLAIPVALAEDTTLTPGIQYSLLPDGDIEAAADALYPDDARFIGSLTLSHSF